MPFETVEEILAAQYGYPAGDMFAWIDRTPLGSASVAQVHAARLYNGQPVVIKVQRRGIHRITEEDIAILRRAARLLKIVPRAGDVIDFNGLLDELWTVSQQEMNFLLEAAASGALRRFERRGGRRFLPQGLPGVEHSLGSGYGEYLRHPYRSSGRAARGGLRTGRDRRKAGGELHQADPG